jgi:hypothetical protein
MGGELGREVLAWDTSVSRWRNLGDTRGVGRVRLEILLIAARGESVYVVSRLVLALPDWLSIAGKSECRNDHSRP